ncbi:MAG: hypothetical protein IKZ82_03785, partial [Clostridia bacterium]|nr:hypothetical protein [Clostridia bacterium]
VSFSMPSGSGSGRGSRPSSGQGGFSGISSQGGEAQPDASAAPEGGSQSGSSGSNGSSRPHMPSGSGSGFSPSDASFPSTSTNSQAKFWILTGASVLVLAVGLVVAAKFKY